MKMFSYIGGGGNNPPFCAVCKSPCSFNRCYNPECSQYVKPIDEFNNSIVIHKNPNHTKHLTREDAKAMVEYSTMEAAEVFNIIDKIFDSLDEQLEISYDEGYADGSCEQYNGFELDSNSRQIIRDGGWIEEERQ